MGCLVMVKKGKRLKVMVAGSLRIALAFSFLSEVSKGPGGPESCPIPFLQIVPGYSCPSASPDAAYTRSIPLTALIGNLLLACIEQDI
ncbi:hypothetical protein B9Z19DRAFT_498271 [Tuber borchii]|uniref:Uncharacterized protein n=1 Tax=Tuber borchii TaxID=42251 RepID=A0A2T6ZEG0_TUBBO|nr:hypothetical protein B9Z19DRAFT_498271 [Tuber borchii]